MSWEISNKTVVITGGTSGIGLAAAVELSKQGAKVFITSRSQESAAQTAEEITAVSGNPVHGFALDLANIASIRRSAKNISQRAPVVDVLVNNAGIIVGKRKETSNGVELTFATNYLGPFLLTQLLTPQLKAAGAARILNLSSELYRNAKSGLDFTNLQLDKGYSPSRAYANSKLAVMLFTGELRKRLGDSGISAFAIHPGVIRSNFGTGQDSSLSMKLAMKFLGPILKSPETGAATTVRLASAPLDSLGTSWYWSESRPTDIDPIALDGKQSTQLWEISESILAKE